MTDSDLHTIETVANVAGVNKKTLRRWERDIGSIPSHHVERSGPGRPRRWYTVEDVRAWARKPQAYMRITPNARKRLSKWDASI